MDRRIFIGGVLGGIMSSFILEETQAKAVRMPTVFVDHGSPMNLTTLALVGKLFHEARGANYLKLTGGLTTTLSN